MRYGRVSLALLVDEDTIRPLDLSFSIVLDGLV